MVLSRHGTGIRHDLAALASQVHPVFMLPPLAASAFGGVLAVRYGDVPGDFSGLAAAVHLVAIFTAVYTAHVKDGYVDFHVRGEDEDHPLTARGCRIALVASSGCFFLALISLGLLVDPIASAITLPTWFIAYHHAPQLDTNPVTATTGYPLGIALSLVGGFYVQSAGIDPVVLAFGLVFLVLLSGVKVIDDAQDVEYDRSIAKRTVAVVLGPRRARLLAYGLMAAALFGVVVAVGLGLFPPGSVVSVLAFAGVAALASRAGPQLATMLLVRGAYLFLAGVVAAVWFEPLG